MMQKKTLWGSSHWDVTALARVRTLEYRGLFGVWGVPYLLLGRLPHNRLVIRKKIMEHEMEAG